MSKIKGDASARLEKVRRRFEQWRRTHRARSRLPESLWAAAVKLGREHGINRTTRALRLDYYSLKKRVEACSRQQGEPCLPRRNETRASRQADTDSPKPGRAIGLATPGRSVARRGRKASAADHSKGPASAALLEVGPFPFAPVGECVVELEDTAGAKMRVHLKGVETIERAIPELALLARLFWGVRG